MGKTVETNVSSINILVAKTEVKGDITSEGDFRIDGTLIGNITIKGKLVVGTTGRVEGNIISQSADFSGDIQGSIQVKDLLVLQACTKVKGDISIGKLCIEPGAVFQGKCQMNSAVINNVK